MPDTESSATDPNSVSAGRARERQCWLSFLLAALALFGVNLSCTNTAINREQPWFFEGVEARWRYYADTLPVVAAQRLGRGKAGIDRNVSVRKTLGTLCYYDPGSEYLDRTELDDSVVVRTYRAAKTDDERRRLHQAYRSGRKLSSRLWWDAYEDVMRDDSSRVWTRDLADSLWHTGTALDSRLHPRGDTADVRVRRALNAFKTELWREYLKSRTGPAR